jgi:hypothetical protein
MGTHNDAEQEIWAVALWVEKHHGYNSSAYIASQFYRVALEGDETGVAMWQKVAARLAQLQWGVPPDQT